MSSQWSCFLGSLMLPSNQVYIVADNARTHSSHFDNPTGLSGGTTTILSRWDECLSPSSDCSPTEHIGKRVTTYTRDCTPFIPKRRYSHASKSVEYNKKDIVHTKKSTIGNRATNARASTFLLLEQPGFQ